MLLESILLAILTVKFKNGKIWSSKETFFQKAPIAIFGLFIYYLVIFLISKDMKGSESLLKYFPYIHIGMYLSLIIAVLWSKDNIGSYILAGGLFLNFIPILFNGRMPVSLDPLLKTRNEKVIQVLLENRSLTHVLDQGSKLSFLGDWIPLPPPYYMPKVISVGDIMISIGIYVLIVLHGTKRRKND